MGCRVGQQVPLLHTYWRDAGISIPTKPAFANGTAFEAFAQDNKPVNPAAAREEHLLNYTSFDKAWYRIKSLFVITPKTLAKGLMGSADYSFSDAMRVANIPYYLGGVFLALSPFIGKDYREGIRQGAAVGTYLLGAFGSNVLINRLYKWRWGIDLTMVYRSKQGSVEPVYASHDFARFDLLRPEHYQHMIRKMNIPPDSPEPEGIVREHIRHIIASSRALKVIVANLASALGAGYIAQSDAWLKAPATARSILNVFQSPQANFSQKLRASVSALSSLGISVLDDRFNLGKARPWQAVVVGSGLAIGIGTLYYILSGVGFPKKMYELKLKSEDIPVKQNPPLQLNFAPPRFSYYAPVKTGGPN